MSDERATTRLRRLLREGCVAMPGAFNAATARLVERSGFDAVYLSGAGMANATAGVPDIGLLSLDEVARLAGYAAGAVKIPAIVDGDTGFGGPQNVFRAVRTLESAGLAGLHLEDQRFPKRCGHVAGKTLVEPQEMVDRIASALAGRRDADFVLIARTDARASEGLDGAIRRGERYIRAGADAVFPEALETAAEFRRFAEAMGEQAILMANMTEFGKSPLLSVRQLERMGYRMVIFPQTAFRVAMRAQELALRELRRRGTQRSLLPQMQTRQALYDLLEYDPSSPTWPAVERPNSRRH